MSYLLVITLKRIFIRASPLKKKMLFFVKLLHTNEVKLKTINAMPAVLFEQFKKPNVNILKSNFSY